MKTAKKWQFVEQYEAVLVPSKTCMVLQEEKLPGLKHGDVLFEALYLSLDPYIGLFLQMEKKTNVTVIGQQIARVAESRDEDYKVGDLYLGQFGWRTHTIVNPRKGDTKGNVVTTTRLLPDIADLPVTLTLGVLGMPGVTGHIALLKKCSPKRGQTVLVSSAAGVVGSVAGQIAKVKGCRVIGAAGSDEKVTWLKEIGFDHVFNYKSCDLEETLKEYAPDGIDIYIENVGGEFGLTVLMKHMKYGGSVAAIGSTSTYGTPTKPHTHDVMGQIVDNYLRVNAVSIMDEVKENYDEAEKDLIQWTKEGKIRYKETIIEGFANMRDAYIEFMKGAYYGKAIVKVSPS